MKHQLETRQQVIRRLAIYLTVISIILTATVLVIASASVADTPACKEDTVHCGFLEAFHDFAKMDMTGNGVTEDMRSTWEAMINRFATWLEIAAERAAMYSLVASDEYQDLMRSALSGDKAAAVRFSIRADRVVSRVETLAAERHDVADELRPLVQKFTGMLNESP